MSRIEYVWGCIIFQFFESVFKVLQYFIKKVGICHHSLLNITKIELQYNKFNYLCQSFFMLIVKNLWHFLIPLICFICVINWFVIFNSNGFINFFLTVLIDCVYKQWLKFCFYWLNNLLIFDFLLIILIEIL